MLYSGLGALGPQHVQPGGELLDEKGGICAVAVNVFHFQPGRRGLFGFAGLGLQTRPVGIVGFDHLTGIGDAIEQPAGFQGYLS